MPVGNQYQIKVYQILQIQIAGTCIPSLPFWYRAQNGFQVASGLVIQRQTRPFESMALSILVRDGDFMGVIQTPLVAKARFQVHS
jgi:hypothetical protein